MKMLPGKEHLKVLEKFAAQQIRLYPDLCDVGIWIGGPKEYLNHPTAVKEIRVACQGLREIYKGKTERWGQE